MDKAVATGVLGVMVEGRKGDLPVVVHEPAPQSDRLSGRRRTDAWVKMVLFFPLTEIA